MYVGVYGYAFRRALRYGAENWRGGRRYAHEVQEHIFGAPDQRSTSSRGQVALRMPYGHQIWSEKPLSEEKCIARVKGHARVNWGQSRVK